jgi:hypothetical protein
MLDSFCESRRVYLEYWRIVRYASKSVRRVECGGRFEDCVDGWR